LSFIEPCFTARGAPSRHVAVGCSLAAECEYQL